MGLRYYNGGGKIQDYPAAVKWFQVAAEKGHTEAQYQLGLMYGEGLGVQQDYNEASKWFRLAAEQGHDDVMYSLGLMYENGHGVKQDYSEAVKRFIWLADKGLAKAQHHLGLMYEKGCGVRRNDDEANKWFTKAAEKGFEDSINHLFVPKRKFLRRINDLIIEMNDNSEVDYEEIFKSLMWIVILVGLFFTNPSKRDFLLFINKSIEHNDISKNVSAYSGYDKLMWNAFSAASVYAVDVMTTRENYYIFSIYTVDPSRLMIIGVGRENKIEILGIAGNFIPLQYLKVAADSMINKLRMWGRNNNKEEP